MGQPMSAFPPPPNPGARRPEVLLSGVGTPLSDLLLLPLHPLATHWLPGVGQAWDGQGSGPSPGPLGASGQGGGRCILGSQGVPVSPRRPCPGALCAHASPWGCARDRSWGSLQSVAQPSGQG